MQYERIPKSTEYRSLIVVDHEDVKEFPRASATMDEILEDLNTILSVHPDATVAMFRSTTRPSYFGRTSPMGHELDEKMRDMIRDNLLEAKKLFAPIVRAVRKEEDDG